MTSARRVEMKAAWRAAGDIRPSHYGIPVPDVLPEPYDYTHGATRVGVDHRCLLRLFGWRGRSHAQYRPTAATPGHGHGHGGPDRCSHARGARTKGNRVARLDAADLPRGRLPASGSPGDRHERGI